MKGKVTSSDWGHYDVITFAGVSFSVAARTTNPTPEVNTFFRIAIIFTPNLLNKIELCYLLLTLFWVNTGL